MIKRTLYIISFICSTSFSQTLLKKSFQNTSNFIEINTDGLDELLIKNSSDSNMTIELFDENNDSRYIFTENKNTITRVEFKHNFFQHKKVFKKYITERLQRATAIITVPKNKTITILGKTIDILSKSYNGNLNIYIDKGLVKLNTVKQNTEIKLFQGNVYATTHNSNIDIKSSKGIIRINDKIIKNQHQITKKNKLKRFTISSIYANINLINN